MFNPSTPGPRLREVTISSLCWGLIGLINVAFWLIDTTLQFMARDAQAIALYTFAQNHDPLPEFPLLAPASVPLALHSVAPAPFPVPVLVCPTVVPMAFSHLDPSDTVRRWLTSTLPLVPSLALGNTEAVPVLPSVIEVASIVPKSHKTDRETDFEKAKGKKTCKQLISAHSEHSSEHTIPTLTNPNTAAKSPRKRSQRATATAG